MKEKEEEGEGEGGGNGGFFFQAEDGIRDRLVTGVQTCALPIFKAIAESRNRYDVVRKEMTRSDMYRVVKDLEVQMKEAAKNLQFEKAAQFRDEIYELRRLLVLEEKTLSPAGFSGEE